MAKSKEYRDQYRKSVAIKKQQAQPAQKEEPEEKKKTSTKGQLGEIVSTVDKNAMYVVYDNRGKKLVERSGARIIEKMEYNNNIKKWVSKAKGNRYIIRKKR